MSGNIVFSIVLVVAALAAVAGAAWGRDRRQDPPDNSPVSSGARTGGPTAEGAVGPAFDEGHQFPGGDEETNLQAQEAGQLIAWCTQHPDTAEQAQQLDARLRALSAEWKDAPEHLRAISKRRYYDWTSSILHDARKLAGIGPHGDPVVD